MIPYTLEKNLGFFRFQSHTAYATILQMFVSNIQEGALLQCASLEGINLTATKPVPTYQGVRVHTVRMESFSFQEGKLFIVFDLHDGKSVCVVVYVHRLSGQATYADLLQDVDLCVHVVLSEKLSLGVFSVNDIEASDVQMLMTYALALCALYNTRVDLLKAS